MSNREEKNPRVLVVDDSSAIRAALAKGLKANGLEVVAGASDPFMARDLIFKLKPDVLTLDLQMPNMDGLTFLSRLMAYHPMPVVVISSLPADHKEIALQAMDLGAVEVISKPNGENLGQDMLHLASAIRRASRSHPRARVEALQSFSSPLALDMERIVAIGASTGGTSALSSVIASLPNKFPALVIVQHMPPGFTEAFANRLNDLGKINVVEAHDGDFLAPGLALLAPGGKHMSLQIQQGRFRVRCREGAPVNHVTPSVDVLFDSMADTVKNKGVGVLLTGMGRDGARGLLAMRQAGARTLAQDEATSVIWGMPGEAYKMGATESLQPLDAIPSKLIELLKI